MSTATVDTDAATPAPAASPALPLWAKTRTEQMAALVQLLSTRHVGKVAGITAEQLAAQLGLHERLLRTLISMAREEGVAICATPDTGYFIAQSPAELELCCAFLRSRAMKSLHIEAQLRRIPLPDLLGQLHLPT